MNPVVREWIEKAEADYTTARREATAQPRPNLDAACYHAQQAAEKVMKALLIDCGTQPPRTHNLVTLHEMIAALEPDWTCSMSDLRVLSLAAVHFRYPGASATDADAAEALKACDRIRASVARFLSVC